MDLHHPLLSEFPELKQAIIRLIAKDEDFRLRLKEYDQIDDQVAQIEEERIYATDCELETLKMKRVQLKDALLHTLRAPAVLQMAH
jgi:uncharacterized protein YdcH (DUF465 family)